MEGHLEIDPRRTEGTATLPEIMAAVTVVISDIEAALAKLDAVGLYAKGAHLSDALDGLRSYRDSLQDGGIRGVAGGANG
jgi:hypothetical protein